MSATVTAEAVRVDDPEARALLDAYTDEVRRRTGLEPGSHCLEHTDPLEFTPPHGIFLLLRLEGRPVACGGLRTIGPATGELKRMYLDPSCRGHGIGRRLLAEMERAAAQFGMSTLRLDTRAALVEARRLYETGGYRVVAPYNDNPDAELWYERSLP